MYSFFMILFFFFVSLRQALHRSLAAVHRDLHAVVQGPGRPDRTDNNGLVQAQADHGGVAAQAILLGDDAGGLTNIGQHLVVRVGHDQDHAGVELMSHIL